VETVSVTGWELGLTIVETKVHPAAARRLVPADREDVHLLVRRGAVGDG